MIDELERIFKDMPEVEQKKVFYHIKNLIRYKSNVFYKRHVTEQMNCQVCGNEKTEIHHPDYKYENIYLVNMLCAKCHLDLHCKKIEPPEIIDLLKFAPKYQVRQYNGDIGDKYKYEKLMLVLESKGFTRKKLASILGVTYPAVIAKLSGKRAFKFEEVNKILKLLDMKYEELFLL